MSRKRKLSAECPNLENGDCPWGLVVEPRWATPLAIFRSGIRQNSGDVAVNPKSGDFGYCIFAESGLLTALPVGVRK
jgi:hypothetical protein